MTFIGPGENSITLEAREPKAAKTRWIFTEISETGFYWRNEDEDEDVHVIVRQRFVAARQRQAVRLDSAGTAFPGATHA
jgi:hypothetical protein